MSSADLLLCDVCSNLVSMATFASGDPTSVCSLCSLAAAVDESSAVNRFIKSCEESKAPLLHSLHLHSSFSDPHLAQSPEGQWAPLLLFEHGLGDRQTSPSATRGVCGVTSKPGSLVRGQSGERAASGALSRHFPRQEISPRPVSSGNPCRRFPPAW